MTGATAQYYRGAYRRHRDRPVSAAEVDRMAAEARAGDRTALRELGASLAGIAEALASKRFAVGRHRGLSGDDLRQEAMASMLGGLDSWDPEASRFRTYAYARARYAVLNAVNEGYLVSVPRQMAVAVNAGDEERLSRHDPATQRAAANATEAHWEIPEHDEEPREESDEDGLLSGAEVDRALRRAWPPLGKLERRVVFAFYGLGDGPPKKMAEIAREEGISYSWADRVRNSALEKMRAACGAKRGKP